MVKTLPATTLTTEITGLTPITTYTFKVTSLNSNEDESDGLGQATVTCQTISPTTPDTDPPVGSILINNNASHTKLNLVTLNLSTNDAVQMRFSNTAT